MAEITTSTTAKQKGVKHIVKKSTRVDLTPMVDLGFLLITFFVFTSALSKPVVMKLNMPYDKNNPVPTDICESCALTVILDHNNAIKYYEGMPSSQTILKQTDYTAAGIRQIIANKKKTVKQVKGSEERMTLIIKPTASSSFKNFVDMADEVTIGQVKIYFIDELTEAEKQLLAK